MQEGAGWVLLAISAAILGYNWRCVLIYRKRGRDVPGFVHLYGGLPAAIAIGLGWTPLARWLWWLGFALDPAGLVYLIGFLRYLAFLQEDGER